MSSRPMYRGNPMPAIILILAILLLAGGCATSPPQVPAPNLAPAPLPTYKEGTTYVYSNGSWERVIDTMPDAVSWESDRGSVSTGSPDFTYKRASWKSGNRQRSREFTPRNDIVATPPTSLWPLRVGNVAGYIERSTRIEEGKPDKKNQVIWRCEVSGTERVSVMAGEFDTYQINCERKAGRQTMEVKTWSYAPEVDHYVRVSSRYYNNRPPRQKELLAVIPPIKKLSVAKRIRIDQRFQKTMEDNKSGQAYSWSSEGLNVQITPVDTFRIKNGTYCRRYVQKMSLPDGNDTFYGMACRDSNGAWVIPHL